MSGKRDSNSRPRPWQGRALPTELLPQNFFSGKILRRRSPAPRHSESKLSLCSRLVRPLPSRALRNLFSYSHRCDTFSRNCSKNVLPDESGAKVVVLGRLSKIIEIFFSLSGTFSLRSQFCIRRSICFCAVVQTSFAFIERHLRFFTTMFPFTMTLSTSDACVL